MTSVYCWFDWEDDTTTVNSISVIKEPRKPWNEYEVGEKITAKLPKYGTWTGVIVEISDSKEDLVSHMNARQQYPVYTDVNKATVVTALPLDDKKRSNKRNKTAETVNEETLEDSSQSSATDDDIGIAGSGIALDNSRPKKKPKKTEKKSGEKTLDENEKNKNAEKLRKKGVEKARLESKTREYEDMISSRRNDKNDVPGLGQTEVQQPAEFQPSVQYIPDTTMSAGISTGNSSWGNYGQNVSNYSYMQDLREADSLQWETVYQPLLSHQELLEQNRDLQADNHNLRQEVQELKARLELRSPQSTLIDLEVTPKKVEFFKRLTRTLEVSQKQSCLSGRQLFGTQVDTEISTPRRNPPISISPSQSETTNSPVLSPVLESPVLETVTAEQTDEQFHWEENVTSMGQKKVQLVGDISCYVTQAQMSHILHLGSQPRKMVVAMLDVLFTREQLSQSSSIGARTAVNAVSKTKALPSNAVKSIKMFVLKHFKTDSGVPCLSDALFNTVINSKCATARRALKSV